MFESKLLNTEKRFTMISLFKKKSEIQKLDIKYQQLLAEAFRLSTINRSLSDAKVGEAEKVFEEIQSIRSKNSYN